MNTLTMGGAHHFTGHHSPAVQVLVCQHRFITVPIKSVLFPHTQCCGDFERGLFFCYNRSLVSAGAQAALAPAWSSHGSHAGEL